MKKLLLIIFVILVFVLISLVGYGIYKNQIAKKDANEYEKLVSEVIEKYGEEGATAMAILERIYILEELGQTKEALQETQKLLQMDLDFKLNSDAIWRIVEYYKEIGQPDQVVKELQGIYKNTEDPRTKLEAILAITNFYRDNGEDDKAIEFLDQVEKSAL